MHTKSFGRHLKLARMKKNLKPAGLAQQSGLNIETIRSIESGKRPPSLLTLIAVSQALDVSPDYLLSAETNQTLQDARGKNPELFDLIFSMTYSEKKRLEDIANLLIEHR